MNLRFVSTPAKANSIPLTFPVLFYMLKKTGSKNQAKTGF